MSICLIDAEMLQSTNRMAGKSGAVLWSVKIRF